MHLGIKRSRPKRPKPVRCIFGVKKVHVWDQEDRCVLWSREAELFEINASGFDCSTGEHSDCGDALGLEVE